MTQVPGNQNPLYETVLIVAVLLAVKFGGPLLTRMALERQFPDGIPGSVTTPHNDLPPWVKPEPLDTSALRKTLDAINERAQDQPHSPWRFSEDSPLANYGN